MEGDDPMRTMDVRGPVDLSTHGINPTGRVVQGKTVGLIQTRFERTRADRQVVPLRVGGTARRNTQRARIEARAVHA